MIFPPTFALDDVLLRSLTPTIGPGPVLTAPCLLSSDARRRLMSYRRYDGILREKLDRFVRWCSVDCIAGVHWSYTSHLHKSLVDDIKTSEPEAVFRAR
jgi:hypothetical protein